jgi:hypothetical protein
MPVACFGSTRESASRPERSAGPSGASQTRREQSHLFLPPRNAPPSFDEQQSCTERVETPQTEPPRFANEPTTDDDTASHRTSSIGDNPKSLDHFAAMQDGLRPPHCAAANNAVPYVSLL